MPSLTLRALPERHTLSSGFTGALRVSLVVTASGTRVESERAPLACVLVLDVSGSMKGQPLDAVVASVEQIAELAQPSDRIGMVAFSEAASEAAPLTPMDRDGKKILAARARRMIADGGTHIEAGLRRGAQLLADDPTLRIRRSILLMSDGDPNRGVVSPEGLADVVRGCRELASVSALGFGARHNEDVLLAISSAGSGRFTFVPDPAHMRRDLAMALGSQGDIVADSIELVIAPADGVEITRFLGDRRVAFKRGGVSLPLGDLEDRGEEIVALELSVSRPLSVSGELFQVALHYGDAATQRREQTLTDVRVDVAESNGPGDPEALATFLLVHCEEERRRARGLADRRQFGGAAAVLRALLAEIALTPGFVAGSGSPLSEAHEMVLDEAVAYERNPSPEDYSVFRKHTVMFRLDQDGAKSVAPRRGPTSQRFYEVASGGAPKAHLLMVKGPTPGKTFSLDRGCTIGRSVHAEIPVASELVSRRHAEVFALASDYWVCDLGSTNPTRVNGQRLGTEPHRLSPGDMISVGDVELRFDFS